MPTAMVFAPAPLLTVTIEAGTDEREEIHLHAGGQGVWIARMLGVLGVDAVLCASFGGETGSVIRALAADAGIDTRGVRSTANNGVYVHDRRSGTRVVVADREPEPLSRHEVDDLYGMALSIGFEADVSVLAGTSTQGVVPVDVHRRLTDDLVRNGRRVVADVTGDALAAVLAGGVTVVKVSHEDLLRDGQVGSDDPEALLDALRALACEGAHHVVLTRSDEPALALISGEVYEVTVPRLHPIDPKGAGDSVTAGVAAGLARGWTVQESIRLGAAAGCLNVTRRGLGSGTREDIERMAAHVAIQHSKERSTDASVGDE